MLVLSNLLFNNCQHLVAALRVINQQHDFPCLRESCHNQPDSAGRVHILNHSADTLLPFEHGRPEAVDTAEGDHCLRKEPTPVFDGKFQRLVVGDNHHVKPDAGVLCAELFAEGRDSAFIGKSLPVHVFHIGHAAGVVLPQYAHDPFHFLVGKDIGLMVGVEQKDVFAVQWSGGSAEKGQQQAEQHKSQQQNSFVRYELQRSFIHPFTCSLSDQALYPASSRQ
ncbi:hypothetical protein [Pelobacter propionicus]|uniref:hypothetical protein n=1 Tax=Pelobacter propionicus TaxID=29543 RepID=UPI0018DC71E3|nr:hypothetical protein [Pelobacter propionicus]